MRLLSLAMPIAFLTGCATGYAIDQIRPKTSLIAPQLIRYGLKPDQAQCAGKSLGQNLTTRQLRRLSDAARAVVPGAPYADPLAPADFAWVATHVNDPEIGPAVASASRDCGLTARQGAEPGQTQPHAAPSPPPGGKPIPEETQGAGSRVQNGPKDYQPSEKLWAAFEAFEQRNFENAANLARAASDQGDSGAQQFLGGLYSAGQGVTADPATAVKYYAMAAEKGWSEAMTNLGMAYQTGNGIGRNPVEALKWYLLASRRATEDPQLVERNTRDVTAAMTLEQLREAGTLVRQWEEGHRK